MPRRYPSQRPERFRLNTGSQLADGLVFLGAGEIAGSTLYPDSSLYSNHGTLTNMDPPTDWVFVPELGRWGLDFDGSNDYVQGAKPALPAGDFAITFWCYPRSRADRNEIFYQAASGSAGRVNVSLTAAYKMGFDIGGGTAVASTATVLTVNSWWCFTATRNGDAIQTYLNGKVDGAGKTSSTALEQSNWKVGLWSTSAQRWDGLITDILIHGRFVSVAEHAALADPSNVMLSGLILPPRRRLWGAVSAAPAAFQPAWYVQRRRQLQGAA